MVGSPDVYANNQRVLREGEYNDLITQLQQSVAYLQGLIDELRALLEIKIGDILDGSTPVPLPPITDVELPPEQLAILEGALSDAQNILQQIIAKALEVDAFVLAADTFSKAANVAKQAAEIFSYSAEASREAAQNAANLAAQAEEAAHQLLSSNEAIRDEVLVAKTQAETAAASASTSSTQSSTAAQTATAAAAQAVIESSAAATAAINANQSATASATSRDEALAYSTEAETFAQSASESANEAEAIRDLITFEAGTVYNPGFEYEKTSAGISGRFPQGWEKSTAWMLTSEWEKLGFSAPQGGGETVLNNSESAFGFLSLASNSWAIAKYFRVEAGLEEITIAVQVWIQDAVIPGSITRNSDTQSFIANDDAAFRITCYDNEGVLINQTARQRWSDTMTQYQHDENSLTGTLSNVNYTLQWTFALPEGTDTFYLELIALDNANQVGDFGSTLGNPRVRFDNLSISAAGQYSDITSGGIFALNQARAAATSASEAESYATDALTYAQASQISSVASEASRIASGTSAASASQHRDDARSYADDAQAFASSSSDSKQIANASSEFSRYMEALDNGTWIWNNASDALGWSGSGATVAKAGERLRITHTDGLGYAVSPDNLDFPGVIYNKIAVKLYVVNGGTIDLSQTAINYSVVGGHGFVADYFARPVTWDSMPAAGTGSTLLLNFDMQQLNDQSADWTLGTIKQIRFHLDTNAGRIYDIWSVFILGMDNTFPYKQAQAAATHRSAAEASETLASQFATASEESATEAETSASDASTSAGQASTAANNALGSAAQAESFSTLAAQSESNAAISEGRASGYASDALVSEEAAAVSATTAAGSAAAASQSASLAANSKNAADTSAGQASVSAQQAAVSETNAAGSASQAATYASTAATAADEAEGQAEAAVESANAAQASATSSGLSATAAEASRISAATEASNALISRQAAAVSEQNAAGHASAAANSETLSAQSAASAADTSKLVRWRDGNFDFSNYIDGDGWCFSGVGETKAKEPLDMPSGFLAGWTTLSFPTNAYFRGGKALKVSEYVQIVHKALYAIDTTRIYRIAWRMRKLTDNTSGGNGFTYIGLDSFDSNKDTLGYSYPALSGYDFTAANGWIESSVLITGESAAPSPSNLTFKTGAKHVRLFFLLNYHTGNATYEVDYISFEDYTNVANSATYSSNALISSQQAAGSAATATGAASAAQTSQTLAAASEAQAETARNETVNLLDLDTYRRGNFAFADGKKGWTTRTIQTTPMPNALTVPNLHASYTEVVDDALLGGRGLRVNTNQYLISKHAFLILTTRRYKMRWRFRKIANSSSGITTLYFGLICYNATRDFLAYKYPALSNHSFTVASGWQEGECFVTGESEAPSPSNPTFYTNTKYACLFIIPNYSASGDAIVEFDYFAIEDTDSEALAQNFASSASLSANQAATSASDAAGSASAAQTSQTLAAQSASNAANSESDAADSASSALVSKNAAATSATNAAGSASQASNSQSLAAGSASQASGHSSNALVSANQAATSASDAAGSAASASASTLLAAQLASGSDLTKNPIFQNWPAANSYPVGYTVWSLAGGTVAKENSTRHGSYEVRMNATLNNALGIYMPYTWTDGLNHINHSHIVVDCEIRIHSGGASGAGVLVYWVTAGPAYRPVYIRLDTHFVHIGNGWYQFKGVIARPTGVPNFIGMQAYIMANYTNLGNYSIKDISFSKFSMRTATNEEIRTTQVSDDISVAVSTETSARIAADGQIEGKYGVKVDANGLISGFGLIATANNAAPTSDFYVNATRFRVASPAQGVSTPQQMFDVGLVNGVAHMVLHGDFFADGQIAARSLRIGNSSNQVINSDFSTGMTDWHKGGTSATKAFSIRTDSVAPANSPGVMQMFQSANDGYMIMYTGNAAGNNYRYFPIESGKRYEASCYSYNHNSNGYLGLAFYDADNNLLHTVTHSWPGYQNSNPSYKLSNYYRAHCFGVAPANAVRAIIFVVKYGGVNSYQWVTRFHFGEALPNQVDPTPWASAGLTTVENGHIKTRIIEANRLILNGITYDELFPGAATGSAFTSNPGVIDITNLQTLASVVSNAGTSIVSRLVSVSFEVYTGNHSSGIAISVNVTTWRNGTAIDTRQVKLPLAQIGAGSFEAGGNISFVVPDPGGGASSTYSFTAQASNIELSFGNTATVYAKNRIISVQENKR